MKPITETEIARWESLARDPCVEFTPLSREDVRRLIEAARYEIAQERIYSER